MLRAVAFAGLSLMLGGCALSKPDDVYSVEEVLADISSSQSELDGKTVSVHGWLGECYGTNCAIFSNLEDAEKVAAYRELPDEEWMPAFDRSLSVGSNDGFDASALLMQFNEVVIVGEINAQWRKPPDESGIQFGCLDRCDDIRPQSVRKIIF
ncbi:hypothetical protein [uncultured Erythrobacter sp.]|uniref:hypothetical protein n=1 Tax=uncultured Erythrobacter sp. TaxID=263913 RepID=UPI002632AABC|nr:hypothetical protein [uncultured Erythrobacter sp.]